MTLTRDRVKELRAKLQPVLDAIGPKVGFKLELAGCTFLDVANFKLVCSPIGEQGEAVDKDAEMFKRAAGLIGLKPTDLGREFVSRGEKFKLVGYNPRRSKYPFVCVKVSNGKRFKFPKAAVVNALTTSTK